MSQADPPIVHPPLLELLLERAEFHSLHALGQHLALSIAAVACELERLRQAGCTLEEQPLGVRLSGVGLPCWADYLRHRLGPGRAIEVYQQTSSTQDVCRRIIQSLGPASHGAVAVAQQQTLGRGRLGRRWFCPPGAGLTFSTVLAPGDAATAASLPSGEQLVLASAVGCALAIEEFCHDQRLAIEIKWPNDLMLGGRKLGGILLETQALPPPLSGACAIMGVGININLDVTTLPPDPQLRQRVASLALPRGDVDRLRLLTALLQRLNWAWRQDSSVLLPHWRQRSRALFQALTFQSSGQIVRGQVIDLDPQQGLVLRSEYGAIVHLPAATTTVLGPDDAH